MAEVLYIGICRGVDAPREDGLRDVRGLAGLTGSNRLAPHLVLFCVCEALGAGPLFQCRLDVHFRGFDLLRPSRAELVLRLLDFSFLRRWCTSNVGAKLSQLGAMGLKRGVMAVDYLYIVHGQRHRLVVACVDRINISRAMYTMPDEAARLAKAQEKEAARLEARLAKGKAAGAKAKGGVGSSSGGAPPLDPGWVLPDRLNGGVVEGEPLPPSGEGARHSSRLCTAET